MMMNRFSVCSISRSLFQNKSTTTTTTTFQIRYYSTLKTPLRVAIVGAPGSGKGTQSAKLERDYGLKPISTGQILRQAAQEDTELGRDIKSKLDAGQLLSDDFMFKVVKEYLSKINTYLLDGYPRTTKQAEDLDQWLHEKNTPLDFVLYLDVPEEVLIDRIQDRWIHLESGRVYNSTYAKPKVAGKDDVTGEPLVRRSDDNEEKKIKDRIDTYHRETMPILKHYQSKGKLVSIYSPNSDVGYQSISSLLNQYCSNGKQFISNSSTNGNITTAGSSKTSFQAAAASSSTSSSQSTASSTAGVKTSPF